MTAFCNGDQRTTEAGLSPSVMIIGAKAGGCLRLFFREIERVVKPTAGGKIIYGCNRRQNMSADAS